MRGIYIFSLCLIMLASYIMPINLAMKTNNVKWLALILLSLIVTIFGIAIMKTL